MSFIKDEAKIEAELLNAIEPQKVFTPNWNNKPIVREPILFLNGLGILTYQNVTCIIAGPGIGKSAICESICAATTKDKGIDTLGFSLSKDVQKILYIDNERTDIDVWNSFYRMHKRAKRDESNPIVNADIRGLRMISVLKERKAKIEELLKEGGYDLLIIDGAGDLVNDTNSLAEAIEMRVWLRDLTCNYNVSILTTLHPNKGSLTPRGHIGSEVLREAETVLGIEKEGEVRTITSDFTHGKTRNTSAVNSSYVWSEGDKMFIQCDAPEKGRIKILEPHELLSNEEINKMLQKVLGTSKMKYSTFLDEIKAYLKQNYSTQCKNGNRVIKEFVTYLSQNDFVKKKQEGVTMEYYLDAKYTQSEINL